MANTERRRFLKDLLGGLAAAAGSVVVAASDAVAAPPAAVPGGDIRDRADRLAAAAGAGELEVPVAAFVNRGFRNGVGGGGFRNGGFANGGGGFRNGGFRNAVGGGFRNGAFRNW